MTSSPAAVNYALCLLEECGIQSKVARNAHEAAFSRFAGSNDEAGDGSYMTLNATRYRAWRDR